jgi:hypothetical protein
MTPEELARRWPVWDVMSDLFLDTEVRWDVPHIARRCVESGYDDETLERIFWMEVFPEAIGNLLQVAGEWAALALDEAALIRRAEAGKLPRLGQRISQHINGWMVRSEWHGVCAVTQWLRPLDETQRTQWVEALRLLGRYYFETPGEVISGESKEALNMESATLGEIWQRYEPFCRAMLVGKESVTHDERVVAVRRLIESR